MKGLVLKDLYVLKDTLKIYALIFLLYGYIGIVQGQISVMYTMVFLTSALLPVTSISYDERSRWDRLANTLPLSRKEIVQSKYLLGFVLLFISTAVTGAAIIFEKTMTVDEKFITLMIIGLVSLVYQSVMIPLIFRFGSEKARFILIGVCLLPVLIIYLFSRIPFFTAVDFHSFLVNWGRYIPPVSVAATALIYILSMTISVKIYSAKDL